MERAIRFVRDSYWAARAFTTLEECNRQALKWRDEVAHQRPWPDDRDRIQTMVDDCPFEIIGRVRGTALTIKMDDSILISSPIRKLESAWKNSLADQLEPVRNK